MVERALELGVNYFDTAPLYGKGRSEEVLGLALEGVTEPHYLATKVGYYPEPFDYTRDAIWRGFEASLKRLRRDRVDLLQVHEAEQAGREGIFGTERTLETLVDIRSQGLAKHIGLTGSDLPLMCEILEETGRIRLCDHVLQIRLADAGSQGCPGSCRGGGGRGRHRRFSPARRSPGVQARPVR